MPNDNLLINGDFQVWQDGEIGFSGTGYTADGWIVSTAATTAKHIFSNDRNHELHFLISAAADVTANTRVSQYIEVIRGQAVRFNGKTITLSFKVQTDTPPRTITAGIGKKESTASAFFDNKEFTISDTEIHRLTLTLDIPENVLSENEDFIQVIFGISTSDGNSYGFSKPTPFKAGSLRMGKVKVEFGNVVTPFVYRKYTEELALCQRRYEPLNTGMNGWAVLMPIYGYGNIVQIPTHERMRDGATLVTAGAGYPQVFNDSGAWISATGYSAYNRGNMMEAVLSIPSSASLVFGRNYLVRGIRAIDARIY